MKNEFRTKVLSIGLLDDCRKVEGNSRYIMDTAKHNSNKENGACGIQVMGFPVQSGKQHTATTLLFSRLTKNYLFIVSNTTCNIPMNE